MEVLKSDDDKRPGASDDSDEPSAEPLRDPSEEPSSAPHDAATPKIDDTKVEITQGHLDVFAGIARNRKLSMVIKDDRSGQAIYRAPEAVTLRVGENAYRKLPQSMHDRFAPEGIFWPKMATINRRYCSRAGTPMALHLISGLLTSSLSM